MKHTKKGKIHERIAAFFIGIMLLIVILITSAQAVCFWIPGWWYKEYDKYNTPQYVTGEMSLDDAVYITEQMLDYCIGYIDTLDDTMATIDGKSVPFFTEREKQHLYDCRNIFMALMNLRLAFIIAIIVLAFLIWLSVRLRTRRSVNSLLTAEEPGKIIRKRTGWMFRRLLGRGYLLALAVLIICVLIIVVMGMSDFTLLFTRFHHLFFDNDLWILNPMEDNLINVMQEAVFADAAMTLGIIWGIIAVILAVLSIIFIKKKRKY